jgi:salicylate hydroxylase
MALEDARALGRSLEGVRGANPDVQAALQRYARERWPRVARVQRRSLRNATIFHATGLLRFARDRVMQVPRVMDVPWLYAHGAR